VANGINKQLCLTKIVFITKINNINSYYIIKIINTKYCCRNCTACIVGFRKFNVLQQNYPFINRTGLWHRHCRQMHRAAYDVEGATKDGPSF